MTITRRTLLIASGAAALAGAGPVLRQVFCPLTAEPACLIPGVSDDPAALLLGSKLYRGLYRTGPDGAPQPDLVASATLAGAMVTLHLPPGLTWHDGAALTADDVVFSIDRFHRRLQTGLDLGWLKHIRAAGPQTVELTLAAPDADLPRRLDALSLPVVPQHVHDTLGFSINPRLTLPVGSGPFRVAKWLRLIPFDLFPGPKAPAAELVCPVLPTAATRTALALTGAPVLMVGEAVDLAALPQLRAQSGLVVGRQAPAIPVLAGVRLNPAMPDLSRADVRFALHRALDPAAAVRQAWSGMADPAPGPGYDVRAASAGLSLAGLRPADDDGIRLRLTHLTTDAPPWAQLAELVRAEWAQVGIDVTIETAAPGQVQRRVASGEYQSAGFAAAAVPDGGLPLVKPMLPVVHDARLRWAGSVFGSFAGAVMG